MTDPRDDLDAALAGLREEIRRGVSGPAGATLRGRAEHQLRVRRLTTAGLAAVAVAALAVGGTAVLRPTAAPPPPPAQSPTASPAPAPVTEPTPAPVTPIPRPAPREPEPLDDPIAEVDWANATISIPPRDICPDGPVMFSGGLGGRDGGPLILLSEKSVRENLDEDDLVAYGDLTGDGRPEAILEATCATDEAGLTSGHGFQPMVVARDDDGTLRGLGWAGVFGANHHSFWVDDGRLLIDADPWTVGPEDWFDKVPGLALAYQWDGSGFGDWQPAPDYPLIAPLDREQTGPPVRPRAVGVGLGCQVDELRFAQTGDGWTATAPGASYTIPLIVHQPFLFDLDRTGERLLVVALSCTRTDGVARHGLAVFEPAGDGWQGISVLLNPAGHHPGSWQVAGDLLEVGWFDAAGNGLPSETYRWTGTALEPVDG